MAVARIAKADVEDALVVDPVASLAAPPRVAAILDDLQQQGRPAEYPASGAGVRQSPQRFMGVVVQLQVVLGHAQAATNERAGGGQSRGGHAHVTDRHRAVLATTKVLLG